MTFEFIQRFTNFLFYIAILLIQYLCDLTVKNSKNMSTKWKNWKMIEKSIKKIMHRIHDKFLRIYVDAKNTNSNFSILIKILRNRNVIWLHNTFFRNDIIWHQIFVVTNLIRFFETILIWFLFVSLIVYFTKLYIIVTNSLKIHRCNKFIKNTSL